MGNYVQRLSDAAHFITGLAPTTPSTSTPDYVSLKGYGGLSIVISADNGGTVTGSAITLHQATAVAGTGEKALAFDRVLANVDVAAASTLVDTAVASNTFTTDTTDNKNLMYVIDVPLDNLDTSGGFDCVRLGMADAANTVLSATYILHKPVYSDRAIDPVTD